MAIDSWMGELPAGTENQLLNQFIFPASHDSGTYGVIPWAANPGSVGSENLSGIYDDCVDAVSEALEEVIDSSAALGFAQSLCSVGQEIAGEMFVPWARAQSLSLRGQLDAGARAFDLRFFRATLDDAKPFAGNPSPLQAGEFYIHHSVAGPNSRVILGDIQSFLEAPGHEKEIIFLGFNFMTEGANDFMSEASKVAFLTQLEESLGAYLVPAQFEPTDTLGDIWATGKQVILKFGSEWSNLGVLEDFIWTDAGSDTGFHGITGEDSYPKGEEWTPLPGALVELMGDFDSRPADDTDFWAWKLPIGVDSDAEMVMRGLVCNLEIDLEPLGTIPIAAYLPDLCPPEIPPFLSLLEVARAINPITTTRLAHTGRYELNFVQQDDISFPVPGGPPKLVPMVIGLNKESTPPAAADDFIETPEDTPHFGNVRDGSSGGQDTDFNGDTLTVIGHTIPAHGSVTVDSTGKFKYTPKANYNGLDSFTYTISDGVHGTATATVNIKVRPVNDAPLAVDDVAATSEDVAVTIDVRTNDKDVDGDNLRLTAVGAAAHGLAEIVSSGRVRYTPDTGFQGVDSFLYTIDDGNGGTNTARVIVSVGPVNDSPVAGDDTAATDEDIALTIAVLFNDSDPDGDSLGITDIGEPAHGTAVLNADGTITYTPASNFHGIDSFFYTIGDGNGGADTATVSVTVRPVNDPPQAGNDFTETNEDTSLTFGPLANDSDADGDDLHVSAVGIPLHGTAVINPDGRVTYTPHANYVGPDSFIYTIGDGYGGTATATVNIKIRPVNDAPVAIDDTALTAEDVRVRIDVRLNDSDVDGDLLAVTTVSAPAHGTAVRSSASTITYTPAPNFHGVDSFVYTIGDGRGGTDTATVVVTVNPVNDAPVAADDSAETAEDTAVIIGVLPNDSDVDGDSHSVTVVGTPAHGTAVLNADGTITYTPEANYHGSDSFTYAIGDGHGGTATATVNVNVNSVNDSPSAASDTALANQTAAVTISVLANDSDPDGDPLSVTAVTQPSTGHGTVTINENGTLTYTQTVFANGNETFTYTISDGQGGFATATVTVTVNLPAKVGLEMLLNQVNSSDLGRGKKNGLVAKLKAAQQSLTKGNSRAAVNQLTAFSNQVRAFKRNHTLTADVASLWLSEVENLSAALLQPAISSLSKAKISAARRIR